MTTKNPITLQELRERGMDNHMQDVISMLVGEVTPASVRGKISPEDMFALGYGPPCECGERGLAPGEGMCRDCPDDE